MITFAHLFPDQLGLNGEGGNLDCLQARLRWVGIDSTRVSVSRPSEFPASCDAVFIGSGTLSGALEALELMRPLEPRLRELARSGAPILALGLGWEVLGREIELVSGNKVLGLGIYSSKSKRVTKRASCESVGFDRSGNLTAGYANHSSEITLSDESNALIQIRAGYGNSSTVKAPAHSDEGFLSANLMAARLNGPLLPLNPHLADYFLELIVTHSGGKYIQDSLEAKEVDGYALKARLQMQQRLLG